MKKMTLVLLVGMTLISCDKNELKVSLTGKEDLTFSGTFETINSEDLAGTVSLKISNGYYECSTNFPFGNGAGKLEANGLTINFIDTLFFAVPAIYGPSYVLSGEHYYEFDGENLKIWIAKNVGDIEYSLKLVK